MSLRIATSSLLGLLMFCAPGIAQPTSSHTKAVDALITSYISEHHVPGMSVAVVQQDRVVLAQGYGLADIENNVRASADTVYRIASISKSITASAVMKLVESGKIDLDVPIQKYCPAFPPKQWPITTRELLSHQSGIRDYRNDEEAVNTRHYTSIDEALRQFDKDPLEFKPGTKMQYTSYGYIVLGCVIEGASGTAYDRYMLEAVFGPAQMPATRLDDVLAVIPHRAHGYRVSSNSEIRNAVFVDISNKPPGSGINSTSRDMGNFVTSLYSAKLVSKSTLEQMLTPAKTHDGKATIYGLGFFLAAPSANIKG